MPRQKKTSQNKDVTNVTVNTKTTKTAQKKDNKVKKPTKKTEKVEEIIGETVEEMVEETTDDNHEETVEVVEEKNVDENEENDEIEEPEEAQETEVIKKVVVKKKPKNPDTCVLLTNNEYETLLNALKTNNDKINELGSSVSNIRQDVMLTRGTNNALQTDLCRINNKVERIAEDSETSLYLNSFNTGVFIGIVLLVFCIVYFGSMDEEDLKNFSMWSFFFKIYLFYIIIKAGYTICTC